MHSLVAPSPKNEIRPDLSPSDPPATSPVNRNLYDLFIDGLSSLSISTQHAFRAATALNEWLPPDQFTLQQLTMGFSRDAKACTESIAGALEAERLELPLAPRFFEGQRGDSLLLPSLSPDAGEPWGVAGIRVVSAFRQFSLHLAVKSDEASEFGFLLGADAVHKTLHHWAGRWEEIAKRFQLARSSFCAAAYMADVDFTAPFHRATRHLQS